MFPLNIFNIFDYSVVIILLSCSFTSTLDFQAKNKAADAEPMDTTEPQKKTVPEIKQNGIASSEDEDETNTSTAVDKLGKEDKSVSTKQSSGMYYIHV